MEILNLSITKKKALLYLQSFLFFLVALLILGFLAYKNKDLLKSYDWDIRWNFILIAFGIDGIALLIGSIVWGFIMKSLGISIGFAENLRHFCINMLARRVPGTVWYIAYRSQFYSRYNIPVSVPTLASGIEAILSVVSAILVALIFGGRTISTYVSAPWIFFPISIVGFGLLHPKIIRWIFLKFKREQVVFKYTDVFYWLMLYGILWILSGTIIFMIGNSVIRISITNVSMIISGWALIGALSYLLLFLPSNLGFNEVGISLLLSGLIPSTLAVIIAFLVRIGFICFELLWSVIIILISQKVRSLAGK